MPRTRRSSSKRSRMELVNLRAKGEGSGIGHGAQTLIFPAKEAPAPEAIEEERRRNCARQILELQRMIAEMSACKPDCTCTYCRPDLDLERLREKGLIEIHDGKDFVRYRRNLLEVFAVKFMDYVDSGGQVRGNMRIPVMYGDYRLFGRDTDGLPCIVIDPFGRAELADADCRLDVADSLDILLNLQSCEDDKSPLQMLDEWENPLWNSFTEPLHTALSKQLDTELGPVEITFAIVVVAVPAYVEVRLLDWPLEQDTVFVDGIIGVGNTDISGKDAVTYLFHKPPKYSVPVGRPLKEGSGALLPLIKNFTSVPRDSALQVYIRLKQRFDKSFRWIAQENLEFVVKPGEKDRQIIQGNNFRLEVIVNWSKNELISFEERTKTFARMDAARKRRLFGSK